VRCSNIRVLARRAVTALRAAETMPDAMPAALDGLAAAVDLLAAELADGKEPMGARRRMERVVRSADAELIGAGGFSTWVVLAQLRSTAGRPAAGDRDAPGRRGRPVAGPRPPPLRLAPALGHLSSGIPPT
jgi:hypothetical protein